MIPRFLLDPHLAELARWLRWLGYDTELRPAVATEARRRLATTDRTYVTTSERWASWARARNVPVLLVARAPTARQLPELIARLGLRRQLRFDRCGLCNLPLVPVTDATPPPAAQARGAQVVYRCPGCGRHYWEGGHTARMRALLERWLAAAHATARARPEAD